MRPTFERRDQARTKTRVDELAVATGEPAFPNVIHVGRPNIGNRQRLFRRINDILDRRWLTNNGEYVQEFERKIRERIGARHCFAVANGTLGLEIAIRALELTGEVIVPSFTFPATVHALQWLGITPVFCDVNPSSHTMDWRCVESLITPRTSGVLAVHLWGGTCDVDELSEIANRNGLKLLFDAAHAFDCSYKGRMIGNFGNAEIFSFHATKFLNTFEGGAVITNDDDVAARIQAIRNLGFRGLDDVVCVGTNGKMNEVSAVMGLTGLESIDDFTAINRRHYLHYRRELKNLPGISLMPFNAQERSNYQYIVVEVDKARAGFSRDDLVQILHAENVRARRYFFPGCHRIPPYRDLHPAGKSLPETERLSESVMCLPTGTTLQPEDVTTICRIIQVAVAHADELRILLSGERRWLKLKDDHKR
jgi:dTDP-4-amino-4,6-dideoxygalactose transaminase